MDNQIHCEKCHFLTFRTIMHWPQTWFRRQEYLTTECGQCGAPLKLPCGIARFECVQPFDKWAPLYRAYWLD